jgi:hypothetical protein
VAEDVLEEDLEGDRCSAEVDSAIQRGETVEVWQPGAEGGAGTEWVAAGRGPVLAVDG